MSTGCNLFVSEDDLTQIERSLENPICEQVSIEAEQLYQDKSDLIQRSISNEIRNIIQDSKDKRHNPLFEHIGEDWVTRGWAAKELGIESIFSTRDRQAAAYSLPKHGFDHVGLTKSGQVAIFESKCYWSDPNPSAGLQQLSLDHVELRLDRMQDQGRELSRGANSDLARMARENGYRRFLVHTGMESQRATVYEVSEDPETGDLRQEIVLQGTAKDFMGAMFETYFPEDEEEGENDG